MEQETKPSIDAQLAEANKAFDARLAKDAKAARKEEGVRVLPKPAPKAPPRPKAKQHYKGEVAHTHFNENDFEIIEVDCKYIEHNVRDKKGFTINGRRYHGRVLVPQCVADYLSMMENKHREMERGVFEDRGRKVNYGEIRG
jgi:hypothetical protein